MSQAQAQHYLRMRIESATPVERIVMLYDGAVRFLEETREYMSRREFQEATLKNIRAQNILLELRGVLDFKKGGDVAQGLYQVYSYLLERLGRANREKEVGGIDEAIEHLRSLRESWEQLARNSEGENNT